MAFVSTTYGNILFKQWQYFYKGIRSLYYPFNHSQCSGVLLEESASRFGIPVPTPAFNAEHPSDSGDDRETNQWMAILFQWERIKKTPLG